MGCEKGGPVEHAGLAEAVDDRLAPARPSRWWSPRPSPPAVDAIDQGPGVALQADLLHLGLGLRVVRPLASSRVGEVVGEALGRIVRDLQAVEAAHVAGGAGGDEHVAWW